MLLDMGALVAWTFVIGVRCTAVSDAHIPMSAGFRWAPVADACRCLPSLSDAQFLIQGLVRLLIFVSCSPIACATMLIACKETALHMLHWAQGAVRTSCDSRSPPVAISEDVKSHQCDR